MSNAKDLAAICRSLTTEEKIRLLAGAALFETAAIPEKGIPAIKFTDGPNGTRGAAMDGNTTAACFPAACSIAATFDTEIARRIGNALGEEAIIKGASCLLAPTVCIHRHPLGGRNFESYSEDPFLSGKMAAKAIAGVQSHGIAATIKHFVANEQETARNTVNETISERALREIYLRPFEIAIKESDPWAVMTAYNHVNGVHCDASQWLLQEVLRGEWGWQGLVMSDWGGTNTVAESLKAGLDLEMPGPPQVRKTAAVIAALESGALAVEDIDKRVRTLLGFIQQVNAFTGTPKPSPKAIDRPEHRSLIREAGARGIVLLKNEASLLPLTPEKVEGKTIALIGFAKDALAHGGGSAAVNAHYKITPWQGLQAALGDRAQFLYAKGTPRERLLTPLCKDGLNGDLVGLDGQPGFSRTFYERDGVTVVSVLHGYPTSSYSALGSQESLWKILEITGDFTPRETGNHFVAFSGVGSTEITIDDKSIASQLGNCSDPMGTFFGAASETEFQVHLTAGKPYRLKIRSCPPVNVGLDALEGRTAARMGFSLESDHDADLVGEAAAVASKADLAIVFTGHDPQWETEGLDQESFHLPRNGSQDSLVSAVAAANDRTIVVNSTGVAVAMPWLDQVSSVLQAWFPGQECGNSIADVLTGVVNPEGRLPVSFPTRIEDAPAHGNFPGTEVSGRLEVIYAEDVFVGYRHYDRFGQDKLNFAFGHGLSYTTFDYGTMQINRLDDETLNVRLSVQNTGSFQGATVVQLYVGKGANDRTDQVVKSLVGFKKVRLRPGQCEEVHMEVRQKDFAYFDQAARRWVIDGGRYNFLLCQSASHCLQTVSVDIEATYWELS
ncbi:glycoside hydrolase superfamily [Boeremia exigua]|uniref:glycoside hydrolase superfamily n=1 Tax=Boeremia exigua TaxID=749465 RepID=UPI001E8E3F86|nr:glycoside hydrolase superfamily [Boeremia exigua]KAH6618830.1 glycoside hydrolase superfamily [Boeremia exigua]